MQIVLVVVILLLLYLSLVSPRARRRKFKAPALLAHRGLHDNENGAPENSLAAFEAAARAGYGIELDVQLTADDRLVVFHDDQLNRVCGRDGNVQQMTLAELTGLALLGTDQKIPTLDEVLALVDGRVPLLIELKSCARVGLLARLTAERLRKYRGEYMIESFNPLALRALKRGDPTVVRGQLVQHFDPALKYAPYPMMLALSGLLLNCLSRPDFIAYDQRMDAGFTLWVQRHLFQTPLCVWTVRSQADYERLRSRAEMIIFEGFLPADPTAK